jgi:hypothetical protein
MHKAQGLEADESSIGIEIEIGIEIDSVQFCASIRFDTGTDFDFDFDIDFDFDFKWSKPQLGVHNRKTKSRLSAALV